MKRQSNHIQFHLSPLYCTMYSSDASGTIYIYISLLQPITPLVYSTKHLSDPSQSIIHH